MENFASYILGEMYLTKKMEMVYYLSKKADIFFDSSIVIKSEIAKMFIEKTKINIDINLVLTACLLYSCKKPKNAQNLEKIKEYPRESSEYLEILGFDEKFCKICEAHNRYTNITPRYKESDILELVDQFRRYDFKQTRKNRVFTR